MSSFPIGSSVLLQNLKSEQYNDKHGIVRSRLDPMSGRQEVYIFDLEKSMSIKPINIKYEPREIESLSISEMKGVLLSSSKTESELNGLSKDDLQKMVADVATDPEEIAALVAKSNEPKTPPAATNNISSTNGSFTSEQLKQATDRMSNMNPDQLRQQAATMKAMGPAALRNMNPQMAHMTDDQINIAISQMEAMANNPAMMKAAAEQMKGMNEAELRQAMGSTAVPSTHRPAPTTTTNTTTMNDTIKNMSSDQFKEASQKISSLTPEQLKKQAAMLKSMPIDTLRRTNPQFANMSEDQIKLAIQQMETMASNPEMLKMASEQIKNMDDAQFQQVKQMFQSGGSTGPDGTPTTTSNNNNMAELSADPSKMMESLLSNPEQLSAMIKTMKQNPDLMKSMLKSQMGINDTDTTANDNPRAKQMEQAIDEFANMSDEQLDKYIRYANKAQSVLSPFLSGFNKTKSALGISSRSLIVLINLVVFGGIALLVVWMMSRGGGGVVIMEENVLNVLSEDEPPEIALHDESEF
ncbi:hypothetical protein ACHAXN_009166 [Cyclotella atomus]